jgi:hypothetical protein
MVVPTIVIGAADFRKPDLSVEISGIGLPERGDWRS